MSIEITLILCVASVFIFGFFVGYLCRQSFVREGSPIWWTRLSRNKPYTILAKVQSDRDVLLLLGHDSLSMIEEPILVRLSAVNLPGNCIPRNQIQVTGEKSSPRIQVLMATS